MSTLIFKITMEHEFINMFKKRMTSLLNAQSTEKNLGVYFEMLDDGTIFQIFKNKSIFNKQNKFTSDNIGKIMESNIDINYIPIGNIMQEFSFPENGLSIIFEAVNDNAKNIENFRILKEVYSVLGDGIEFSIVPKQFKATLLFKTKESFAIYGYLLNQRYSRE